MSPIQQQEHCGGTVSKVLGELQVDEVHVDVLWSGTFVSLNAF